MRYFEKKESTVMSSGYIVKRAVEDRGPMGDRYAYVKVAQPLPNEIIYHGQFRPIQVNCGQYDADSRTEYVPVGEISSERFAGGSESF